MDNKQLKFYQEEIRLAKESIGKVSWRLGVSFQNDDQEFRKQIDNFLNILNAKYWEIDEKIIEE